jgi:hypothetical protein
MSYDPIFGLDLAPLAPDPPPAPPVNTFTLADLKSALHQITPTILVVGIATGAAFAIGSKLVDRYIFR